MKLLTRKIQQKINIEDLFGNLGIDPYENNYYPVEFPLRVLTPYGYNEVDALFTTEKQPQITSYFSDNSTLTSSKHHLLKTAKGEWQQVKDIPNGSLIEALDGRFLTLKKKLEKKNPKVLYDMTVRDVNCYYSNNVLSHNSWTCIAMAGHAVKLGFNVNYYTLELSQAYVGKRVDCYFTGYSMDQLKDHKREVESIVKGLKGNLTIKEYPPKMASINTIKSHIQRCIDMEKKPDLVIIDYIDYLRAASKSRYSDRKDEIDDNYIAAKRLGKEFEIPIVSPSQVNRLGAKDDIIEGDKAAGSYDKIMVSDICFSLSRKKEDKVAGTGRTHMMKNRYGDDGQTYNISINTSNGQIEFKDLVEDIPQDNTKKVLTQISKQLFEKKLV